MKKTIIFLASWSLLTFSFGAKLTFTDGSILEGKIKKITDDKIILEYDFGEVERLRNQVVSISNLLPFEKNLLNSVNGNNLINASDKTSSQESQIPESNLNKQNLEQSALDSLILLKEKLQLSFEKEKAELVTSYNHQKQFMETKLEELSKRILSQEELIKDLKKDNQTSNVLLEEERKIKEKYEKEILNLKNELSYINEARLKSEVAYAENLQNAIIRNKKLLEKEKQSLIESYEGHIAELERQLNTSNIKILELGKVNSELSSKLANAEKLSDQTGIALASLEKQFENYKGESKKALQEADHKASKDRTALEKMLSDSADMITNLKNEVKMLQEEVTFLKDEKERLLQELGEKKKEIEYLEQEKERYKKDSLTAIQKLKVTRKESAEEQKNLLKSLVNNALVEGEPTDLQEQAKKALEEARKTGEIQAEAGRSALFQLFQKDISRLTEDLNQNNQQLQTLTDQNRSLKTEIQKTNLEIKRLETEKEQAEERAVRFAKEKQELKDNVEVMLKQIKEDARKNLEKEKTELRKQFEEAIQSIEAPSSNKNVKKNDDETFSNIDTEDYADYTEIISEVTPEPAHPVSLSNNTTEERIEVGNISQIEPEFSRVFIETKERLKEGDILFVFKEKQEFSFKVIKIYEVLGGAIAEMMEPKQSMEAINLNDVVYLK